MEVSSSARQISPDVEKLLREQAKQFQRSMSGKTPTARVMRAMRDIADNSPAKRFLRKVDVPCGERGGYAITNYVCSEQDASIFNLREALHAHRFIEAGTYTRLSEMGETWMTDTQAELIDHIPVVDHVYYHGGYVLILGLGLGIVVQAVLDMPQVEGVTVLDISSDIIALVGPHYKKRYGDRLNIVEADAMKWEPDHLYSAVWADIWPTLSEKNLADVKRLKKRYESHGWFGAWAVDIIRARNREWQNERKRYKRLGVMI